MNMKKTICIDGSLAFPLQVGRRAVIRRGGDFLFTSLVVEIHEEQADFVCFETMKLVYQVSPAPVPVENVMLCSFMRAA
jgi:hypothetical protein